MNILHSLFASVIAFFVSFTGVGQVPQVQQYTGVTVLDQVAVDATTTAATSTLIMSVPITVELSLSAVVGVTKDSFVNATNTFYIDGVKVRDEINARNFTPFKKGVYILKNNQVYYDENKNGGNAGVPVSGADPKTFVYLDYSYSKDANNFYVNEKILVIPKLSKKDFTIVSFGIVKDSRHVFVSSAGPDGNGIASYEIIKEADPTTFIVDQDGIPKDRYHVYTWRKDNFDILPGADPFTVKKLVLLVVV